MYSETKVVWNGNVRLPWAENLWYIHALPCICSRTLFFHPQVNILLSHRACEVRKTGHTIRITPARSKQYIRCSQKNEQRRKYNQICHLGGVVVSVLVPEPKGRGFKPSRGDGFVRAIKTYSILSFGWEVKLEAPYRKILRHFKDPLTYLRCWYAKFTSSSISPTCSQMSLRVGLPKSSGGRVSFPSRHHHHHGSSRCQVTWGMDSRPVDDRGSET
jgi:hypothetical protein